METEIPKVIGFFKFEDEYNSQIKRQKPYVADKDQNRGNFTKRTHVPSNKPNHITHKLAGTFQPHS